MFSSTLTAISFIALSDVCWVNTANVVNFCPRQTFQTRTITSTIVSLIVSRASDSWLAQLKEIEGNYQKNSCLTRFWTANFLQSHLRLHCRYICRDVSTINLCKFRVYCQYYKQKMFPPQQVLLMWCRHHDLIIKQYRQSDVSPKMKC